MKREDNIRWGGLAAVSSGALAIMLAPLATFAGWMAGPGHEYPDMMWARVVEPLVTPFLGFGAREEVYATYGKMFLPVYLLFVIGLVSLQARMAGRAGRLEKIGFRIMLTGLVMNVIGNVGDYWLGEEVLRQPLWGMTFAIGTLLGTLVYITGSVLLGIAILRTSALPRLSGWTLIIAPTLGIVLGLWQVKHLPSALVLPVGLGWMLLGYALWSGGDGAARQPARGR